MGYKRAEQITIPLGFTATNPADATDYFFGIAYAQSATTGAGIHALLAPCDGVIKYAAVNTFAFTTAGSAEPWTFDVRVAATNYTISSVASNAFARDWVNANLEIPVSKDDLLEFHTLTPTWAANPVGLLGMGLIIISF